MRPEESIPSIDEDERKEFDNGMENIPRGHDTSLNSDIEGG